MAPTPVIAATGATFAITFALTLYACLTKTDFTVYYGFMVSIAVIGLLLIVASFFMSWAAWWHPLVSAFLLLMYAGYLIIDT